VIRSVAAAAMACVLLAGSGSAMAAAPRASLPDIEDEVMCPVCGVPLNIADAAQAQREREFIRALIARGYDKGQIKDALVAQFGPSVLALPRKSGFDLAAYAVPLGAGLVALAGLVTALVRWRRRGEEAEPTAAPALSGADARRLEEDLARYDV
jgi:cytochrome c-type biogenesis protein CcmH